MYGPYDHGWMFGGGGMLLGGLWMILVLAIPLLALFALLKYLFSRPRGNGDGGNRRENDSPLDILKEAYARGDIGREEYLQKRGDLLEK